MHHNINHSRGLREKGHHCFEEQENKNKMLDFERTKDREHRNLFFFGGGRGHRSHIAS